MAAPSVIPGMGARLHVGGTSFRVWAPFADQISVAGQFNRWSETAHPLAPEAGGFWSCDVSTAENGHEYKYVIRRGSGAPLWKNDPYARETTNSNGNSVIRDLTFDWGDQNGFGMPPWNELVIYEMHAGTFNDTLGGGPGDFDRVIERLDYLRGEVGVNAILLLPSAEFPGGISLGYNPSHLFAIERDYGGPLEFKRFIRTAHERGVAVILDVVYNHWGPNDLDLKQFDGWYQNTHPDGIYFYDEARITTPWGGPRPDYGRDEVWQFILDNILYWIEEFRVDGLRFDATNYIRTTDGSTNNIPMGWALMRHVNRVVNQRQPWKIMIAEDMQNYDGITRADGEFTAGFDSQWDAGFVHPIRHNLITSRDEDRDMYAVRDAVARRYNGDSLQRVIYTESHDEVGNRQDKRRLPEEIWRGNADSWFAQKRSTLGAALVMTAPGIPMIFQGQEFLEDGWFDDEVPLDWSRKGEFVGILNLYRDLIHLRRNWNNNTRGLRGQHINFFHLNNQDKVIAYHRWENGGPGDDVVIVANFGGHGWDSYSVGFPRPRSWYVRFNSDWDGYSGDFGNWHSYDTNADQIPLHDMPCRGNVGIGAYSAIILSQ